MVIEIGVAVLASIVFVVVIWPRIMRRFHKFRARNLFGEDVVQWAEELNQDKDIEFILASQTLPKMEMVEIAAMAESKDELRELAVERFDELADDEIPEDFA